MAFRDDREAALARADSLDREVRRLEEENAQLREERERAEVEKTRAIAAQQPIARVGVAP